jgi:hypothetical protein
METTKRIVILLILGLLAAGPGQSAEKPARRISNTYTASCLVKITCDPAILPLNLETIDYLLRSSGVGGKAACETLEFSADKVHDLFTIEYVQLLTSDAHGDIPPLPSRSGSGLGAPPTPSRRDPSEIAGSDMEGMDEYMYEMRMEDEMGTGRASSTRPGSSSSRSWSTSPSSSTRSRYGTTRTLRTVPTTSRTPSTPSASSADGRTYLFSLNIHLPEEVKPAAKEFMNTLVANLRHALLDAYDAHVEELQSLLQFTEERRDSAQTQAANAMERVEAIKVTPPIELNPADAAVHEQLEQIVDLSALTQSMTFEDVIMEVKNSVDPPLQIQPNWKDLLDMAELEPTTPAGMDPLSGVKLRKALELLLAGVSSDFAEVAHVVDEGVIVIATKDTLPKKMVSRVYEIPAIVHSAGNARSLVKAIKESIEPESWFDLSDIGKGTIGVYMGSKLAILQTDDVHLKIHKFLQSMTTDIPASTPSQIPTEMLLGEKRNLFREIQGVEMEIARLLARQSAIERQIAATEEQIAAKLKSDPVTGELQQLVEMHAAQLALMERQFQAGTLGSTELAAIREKLTRAKIELAQRHEQLSKSAGGDQLAKYNNELADKTIEFAEKTAALQVLSEQLGQTQQQLMTATVLDPQVSRIRQATRAFEIADQRVNELNTRTVNLQPPVVAILGGE